MSNAEQAVKPKRRATGLKITTITLGVRDLDRARRFYSEGLGCTIDQDQGGFVSFDLGDGSSALSLYRWEALAGDARVPADGSGFRGVTLNYIVTSNARVDEAMARAEGAGAKIVQPAQKARWGGYSGHFSDPDGYLWKVVSSDY